MNSSAHTLFICTTCRRDGANTSTPRDGTKLYDAVQDILAQKTGAADYKVLGVECMSGCNRACTVAVSAPDKPTYLFGDLAPSQETAAQVVELMMQYCSSSDGVLQRGKRPPALQKGILAKLPPSGERPANKASPNFDAIFRTQLIELMKWRRDVRRFRPDAIAPEVLDQLLQVADLAPSVGLSQPWRFVMVNDPARRAAVRKNFEEKNAEALSLHQGERAALYARLKLAGIDEAPCHFAVFSESQPDQGHGLGRLTMPETTNYSSVMAVHNIWLVARAYGLGLGWVSILDPKTISKILDVPLTWDFIGYFCLGYPQENSETPELERQNWEQRQVTAPKFIQR